jgi:hypothetical protein
LLVALKIVETVVPLIVILLLVKFVPNPNVVASASFVIS